MFFPCELFVSYCLKMFAVIVLFPLQIQRVTFYNNLDVMKLQLKKKQKIYSGKSICIKNSERKATAYTYKHLFLERKEERGKRKEERGKNYDSGRKRSLSSRRKVIPNGIFSSLITICSFS